MLSEKTQHWIRNIVLSEAFIQAIDHLPGATSSIVYGVKFKIGQVEKEMVLRQYTNKKWLTEEPEAPLHEKESLLFAYRASLLVPQLIADDVNGEFCEVPSLLMTKLPGKVILAPERIDNWIEGLAYSLSQIHKTPINNFPWKYFTYMDVNKFKIPEWSKLKDQWQKVIQIINSPRPKSQPCFIHRDYHPVNILWENNKVSGIVDWPNACIGPASVDVGHCRVNLAMLFGNEVADKFLSSYQKYFPNFRYESYWDAVSLVDMLFEKPKVFPGWLAFGIKNLTDEMIVKRIDNFMIHLLSQH